MVGMTNSPDSLFLEANAIRALAPASLPRRLEERYAGGAIFKGVTKHLSDDERATIQSIYEEIGQLMKLTDHKDAGAHEQTAPVIEAFARDSQLVSRGATVEDYAQDALATKDDRLHRFFLEMVGGPFFSICGLLFLIRQTGLEPEYIQTLFYHSRDHRKIMRSLYAELDPGQRASDESVKNHSVDLLIEKWRDAAYRTAAGALNVRFQNEYHGDVAERCVEFAEVDRLFFHLVNNAIHYASESELGIQLVESASGADLLWLFSNPISPERQAELDNYRAEKKSLFEYGVGVRDGVGLESLAETVAHAYGLDSPISAETAAYVGVISEDGFFRLWFHWPKV